MSESVKNILIVGVGGQGTLLASKLMGKVFTDQGFDVKVSEVHGMSQRGGSVVTYVRYGDKVYSSVIEKGEADIILAFEQLEAARWLPFLKPGGVLIASTQRIDPMPVIMGTASYPESILPSIQEKGVQVIWKKPWRRVPLRPPTWCCWEWPPENWVWIKTYGWMLCG